jgi:hypothetical protein
MPIDKFRFVSPGVQVQEIDNSQIPRLPDAIGPVIIGRSLRGPVMRPVKVNSFSDFVEVFGEPVAGGIGGDVWREGNKTAPTYAAYAAQAYLRNSSPVTFVRLAGYKNPDSGETAAAGAAGWSVENAYGLFVMPISQSASNVFVTDGKVTASLAAVVYTNGVADYGLTGKPLSGALETISAQKGKWVRANGPNLEFKLSVHDNTVGGASLKTVNFDTNSKNYIRTVLNTNPVFTNDKVVESKEDYFLGETFRTWVEENIPSFTGSQNFAGILLRLDNNTVDFANHLVEAEDASSGWVVSQHKGTGSAFVKDGTTGEYPVQKLFKFVGLTEGEWNSQNVKISIEDIKEPPNEYVKYGSFTVSVRKLDDNDLTPQYLERFTNVSLDPSSESFIAKAIGDKYTEWNYEKQLFEEYGTYDNKSKFIRVEMNQDVENGLVDTDLVPFGFYGPAQLPEVTVAGNNSEVAAGVTGFFYDTAVSGNSLFTASFALPTLPLLESASQTPVPGLSSIYWGLKTNYGTVKKHNKDLVDYLRPYPKSWSVTKPSFLFTLDDVSGSVSGSALVASGGAYWAEGNRASGKSLTSYNGNLLTSSNGSRLVLSTFNKFTMPLVNGSDGLDITEKDPFNRRVLADETQLTSYAYNSLKVAVESIADPEVVEMNLATIPGVDNEAITGMLLDKCEARGDALAIIDLKGDYVPEEGKESATTKASARKPVVADAIANLKNRAINSSYGCAFFPWVLVRDNLNNNTVWVPPSVAALGTFSSSQRRTELWFAPAGFNRGGLTEGSAGLPVLQTALRLSSKDRDALYEANINPIATFPSEGIVIFGQKTLQVTPSALDRINVRRLMIYLKKEISRFASSVLFDPNIQTTWKGFTNLAEPFLASVKSRFGLSDYRLILDETTTTPELVDRNIVYAKILLKPTRAIEFIAIDFVITNTGASFND